MSQEKAAQEEINTSPTLSEQDLFELRRIFSSADNDNDGLVEAKDLPDVFSNMPEGLESYTIEEEELKNLLEQADIRESESISFAQFLTIIAYKVNAGENLEELQEAYLLGDLKNIGYITAKDLVRVMRSIGENITDDEAQEMMRVADNNFNGKLSFVEFVEMIRYGEVIL